MATGSNLFSSHEAKKLVNTYGGTTQPVYINSGVPTNTTYTLGSTVSAGIANRLVYYSVANTLSATGHYASTSKVAINSTSAPTETLYVNGTTSIVHSPAADTGIFTIQSNTTPVAGDYQHGLYYLVPNMIANTNAAIYLGKAKSAGNTACLQMNWQGDNSNSNCFGLGFWAVNNLLRIYRNGSVSIGADNNSYKLYVNGTSYLNGAVTIANNSATQIGSAPYFTIKSNDASYYSVLRFATPASNEAAVLFLNCASRTGDGGASTMTLRNNVGNLRLDNNTFNTGTFTVGDSVQTAYKCQVSGTLYASTSIFTPKLMLMRSHGASYGKISFYADSYHTWMIYMSPSGSGNACSGGTAPSYGGVSSWAMRFNTENASNYGWIWESTTETANGNPDAKMALRADTGDLTVKNNVYVQGSYHALYSTNGTIAGFRNESASNREYYWGFNGGSNQTYAVHYTNMTVGRATTAGSVDRATFGNSGNAEHNCNNIASNGLWYYSSNGPATSLGATTGDGALYTQAYSTSWVGQIAQDYRNGKLYVRAKNNGSWTSWLKVWIQGDSVTSAVWNDYAECRTADSIEPGYVFIENGDDTLSKSTERLQPFAGISSDTWGFSEGETETAKTHIAVAGRVLAYTYRPRDEYKPGDCVCTAPGGTVDIMTREEVREWPDRIVGTVSCVPDYEVWGGGELADREPVQIDGRIWIRIR